MNPELIYFSELNENFPDPNPDALEQLISNENYNIIFTDLKNSFNVWKEKNQNKLTRTKFRNTFASIN